MRARKSSPSSTCLSTQTSLALSPANVSPTRPACILLYQRSRRRSIISYIYLDLWVTMVLFNTTLAKTRGLS